MKRLAMAAFLILAVGPARIEARSLPKPKSLTDRPASSHQTHYVRGSQKKLPEPVRDESRGANRDFHPTHLVRGN
jgi:hypothetical protein